MLTVHEGFSDKKYSCGLEHCEFQITTERQVLLFRAGSREERDAWIENLKPIMQGYLLHALITAQGVRLHPPTSPSCPHQIALALASLPLFAAELRSAFAPPLSGGPTARSRVLPRSECFCTKPSGPRSQIKPFKTMWFVLKSNKLHCFKKPDDIKVAMTSLTVSSVVLRTKEEAGNTDENISDDLDFLMYYGDDIHLIRCAHEEDRDEWVENLRITPTTQSGRGSSSYDALGGAVAPVQFGGMSGAGGASQASPRFGGLKKGARVLSKKMGSAADLVDGAVHGSVKMGKGTLGMAGGIAGGAVHLAGSAVGMGADEDDEYSEVGQVGIGPILEGGKKMVNPMAGGIGSIDTAEDEGGATPPPPLDQMAGSKRQVNPMNAMAAFGHMEDDDSSDDSSDDGVPLPAGIPLPPGGGGGGGGGGGSGGGAAYPGDRGGGVGAMSDSMQSMDLGAESDAPSVSDAGSMNGSYASGGADGSEAGAQQLHSVRAHNLSSLVSLTSPAHTHARF